MGKKLYQFSLSLTIAVLLFIFMAVTGQDASLPELHIEYKNANARTEGDQLIVSTGLIERTWELTGNGLITSGIRDLSSEREWCTREPEYACDWDFPGLIENTTASTLVSLITKISDDEHFTSEHIEIIAEFHYETQVAVQYLIWVYPGAPGIRTQLKVRALHGMNQTQAKNTPARNEYIPLNWTGLNRRAIGFYNNTQKRNAGNLELIKESLFTGTVIQPEKYDWTSLLVAEDKEGGLVLVKESHKCVNQPGLYTGSFHADIAGFSSTGWGISAKEIITDRWRSCWANWCIVFSGSDSQREMAVKRFDRCRYPVVPELDIYMLANTWGSGNKSAASREENVLLEIETQASLGIDVQQIDDGWQNPRDIPWAASTRWAPHPDRYPEGWENVDSLAKSKGIELGLWFAVGGMSDGALEKYGNKWFAGLEDLKRNYNQGGFRYYKFDMVYLNNYDALESLMEMSRSFVKYTGHKVRINWDVTEILPRTGYYLGRDMGNIYLANRQPERSREVVYVPYLMLRDAWQVSRYLNLNKFQITIQNIDKTDKTVSNAYLYNHPYSVAIALMGSPVFFQETHYYSKEARDQIRPLLTCYKQYRTEMYKGFVFPIGDKPDDRSWTGFQNYHPESRSGFLMIFRELHNNQEKSQIKLNFVKGKTLSITNLVTGEKSKIKVSQDGFAWFQLENPASFLYLKYETFQQ